MLNTLMLVGGVGLVGYTLTQSKARPAIACGPNPEPGSVCAQIAADDRKRKMMLLGGGALILGALIL